MALDRIGGRGDDRRRWTLWRGERVDEDVDRINEIANGLAAASLAMYAKDDETAQRAVHETLEQASDLLSATIARSDARAHRRRSAIRTGGAGLVAAAAAALAMAVPSQPGVEPPVAAQDSDTAHLERSETPTVNVIAALPANATASKLAREAASPPETAPDPAPTGPVGSTAESVEPRTLVRTVTVSSPRPSATPSGGPRLASGSGSSDSGGSSGESGASSSGGTQEPTTSSPTFSTAAVDLHPGAGPSDGRAQPSDEADPKGPSERSAGQSGRGGA